MKEVYVVQVNLGSADHGITVCRKEEDGDFDSPYWDVTGDIHALEKEVGEVTDKGGLIKFVTNNYEEAETFCSGIWAVRRMLRNWIDS